MGLIKLDLQASLAGLALQRGSLIELLLALREASLTKQAAA
jgi:hypothetical protein